jgi:hypothetical protein
LLLNLKTDPNKTCPYCREPAKAIKLYTSFQAAGDSTQQIGVPTREEHQDEIGINEFEGLK